MASLGGVLQGSKVPTGVWEERRRFLMQTSIAWAPCCHLEAPAAEAGSRGRQQAADSAAVSLLAVGTQSGHVVLWRQQHPPSYALQVGEMWMLGGMRRAGGGGEGRAHRERRGRRDKHHSTNQETELCHP
jgi:hypothetical protein